MAMTPRSGTAGFSMIEMLIALAIASLVMIGVGGLVAFGVELRDRSILVADIERALLDLSAFSSLIEEAGFESVGSVGDDGFELAGRRNLPSQQGFGVRLAEGLLVVGPPGVSIEAEQAAAMAALDRFDDARMDYLVQAGSRWHWEPARNTEDQRVRGARLILKQAHRSWPVVIWVEPKGVRQ
jgi:prepilin-type N-terminal cleavage/methylation domain-containing protein